MAPITHAVTDCTRTSIESAIMNRAPLADFDEYETADTAAKAVTTRQEA